jgi:hypothetical protein
VTESQGNKSKYQLKQRRKKSRGPIDPRWMSWFDTHVPTRVFAPEPKK